MKKKLLMMALVASSILVLMGGITAQAVTYTTYYDGLKVGVWMLDSQSYTDRSDWLGSGPYEPINILFKVKAGSTSQAMSRVNAALNGAGYYSVAGHGCKYYYGYMGSSYYRKYTPLCFAYSDRTAIFDNNHGRIFGARYHNGYYYVLGAFSREKGVTHAFINFNTARDKVVNIRYQSGWSYGGWFYAGNASKDHNGYIKVLVYNP